MRKKAAAIVMTLTAISLVTGCGSSMPAQSADTARTKEVSVTETAEENKPVADEGILAKYMTGIRDRNILEGARDIDYLSEAGSIEPVIRNVEVDDKDVDTSKSGTYTVRYRVTVDLENLEKAENFLKDHPEAAKTDASEGERGKNGSTVSEPVSPGDGENQGPQEAAEMERESSGETPAKEAGDIMQAEGGSDEQEDDGTEDREPHDLSGESETVPDEEGTGKDGPGTGSKENMLPDIPAYVFEGGKDDAAPGETAEIIIEKEVRIVTTDEAVEIIREGGEVWTDESRPVEIGDIEKPEPAEKGDTAPAVREDPVEEEMDNAPEDREVEEDAPEPDGGENDRERSSDNEEGGVHTHDWVEQTETVHHEEKGHYENVEVGMETIVDEEAWDEPVYDYVQVCSVCGYSTDSDDDIIGHMLSHTDENGDLYGSYSSKRVQVDTIHHSGLTHEEPVYEQEWVVDSEAWDEEVVTGYRCRTCGAEK